MYIQYSINFNCRDGLKWNFANIFTYVNYLFRHEKGVTTFFQWRAVGGFDPLSTPNFADTGLNAEIFQFFIFANIPW